MWNHPIRDGNERVQRNNFNKKGRGRSPENIKNESDFYEELPEGFQVALKKYNKNIKRKPVEESVSKFENSKPRKNATSFSTCSNKSRKFPAEVNDLTFTQNDDLQELMNYFLSIPNRKEKSTEKTHSDYEKQGAIPKTKVARTPRKCNKSNYKEGDIKASFDKKPKNLVSSFKNTENFEGSPNQNNLGKDIIQKIDSHLNIGPSDSKNNEFISNLEINNVSYKFYEKDLYDSKVSRSPQKTKPKSRIFIEAKEDNFLKKNEVSDIRTLFDSNPEISDDYKDFLWKYNESDCAYETEEENNGRKQKQNLDCVMQRLMSEFPNFDGRFALDIATKYLNDENGLEEFINCERLKIKKEQQLERMILALPESDFEELQEKCEEFDGDEDLVTDYIETTQKAQQSLQIFVELQSVFPHADPDFLLKKIKNYEEDIDIDQLTNELLDQDSYPKISPEKLNVEKRKLWEMYVESFDVKNFILEVPNPKEFVVNLGHQADHELLLKFLMSRYPDSEKTYLTQILQSSNYDLIRTCKVVSKRLRSVNFSENTFLNEDFDEKFLKAIVYIEREKQIEDYLISLKELKQIEAEEARINDAFLTCPLCTNTELIASEALACPDGHIFCEDCIKRYISVKVSDGFYKFSCPSENCDTFFSNATLREVIPGTVLSRIMRKQQAEEVIKAKVDGLESCPNCDFAYIPNAEEKIFRCQNPECLSETCRKCGEKNHIPLRCEEIERQIDVEARKKIEETMSKQLIRSCPNCFKSFVKIDGCNKIKCSCGALICYICRKQIQGYEHFNRVSGDNRIICPLHSNNDLLHTQEVQKAGLQAKNEILQDNPNINILHDPTKMEEF